MKIGITLAELAASVQRIGASLRAARLGKLPPQPQAPERPGMVAGRPRLGPWGGSTHLGDYPALRNRFNLHGTTTGRLPSGPAARNESALPQSDDKRCVRCGQEGHRSSQCPQKWFQGDFHSIELRVLASLSDAERQALLDSAPPGTHWEITEASGFTEAMWRNLPVRCYYGARGGGKPARCPWDDWKAERAFY